MMAQPDCPPAHYALECKAVWAARLLNGSKTIEVRSWPLPIDLTNTPIALVATEGPEGQATLGDDVVAGQADGHVVGEVVFAAVKRYESAEAFWGDEAQHGVPRGSVYGWADTTTVLYGWCVGRSVPYAAPMPLPAMKRVQRSLYCKK